MLNFLRERNPFNNDEPQLRNIETNAIGDKNVNVDKAKAIGQTIIKGMEGKKVTDFSFKRSSQVLTLGSKTSLKVDSDEISIDPQILFQRLVAVSDDTLDDTEEIFRYELSSQPSSLFDSSGLLREAQKPSLAAAIREHGDCIESDILPGNVKYVLDGGTLLQRMPWTHGSSFSQICADYACLIKCNFGSPYIVFDGYQGGPSIRDVTHERRSKGNVGVEIKFDGKTPFRTKRNCFSPIKKTNSCSLICWGII